MKNEVLTCTLGTADTRDEITVLAVDDDPDTLDLTATFLERERGQFTVITSTTVDAALEHLASEEIDCIVSDYEMPDITGLEFLETVRQDLTDIPFILFTGKGSEEIASEAITKGVTDYLQKKPGASQYSLLANRIQNAVDQYWSRKTLERSEEKFSKLVENSTDVIGVVDQNACFTYVSPACERALGYQPEELTGSCAFDFMPPDDRKDAMEAFFEGIENPDLEPTIEFRFQRPEGDWAVVEARGKNLLHDDFINGYVVTARDISELKQNERELQQQNEQLRTMRRVISHDLQSPLNVASGFLDLYRESGDETHLEKVDRSLQRLDTLLEQILALSDSDSEIGEREQISLIEIVHSAWEMVDSGQSSLHVENSQAFEADPDRFQQVVENVLRNAVEHSNSPVTIRVGTTESGIYFEDTGPGIPQDKQNEVFEPGYTTSQNGTGFGLNIAKQIVIGHGWEITANDSETGTRIEISNVTFQPKIYE